MLETIKKVSNPLTIIAIFAALAEINSTVAIGLVKPELQHIFIWFIILFPTLLIVLFFLTLNLNPKVIYAPSDFKNEDNFLKSMSGKFLLEKIDYRVDQQSNNVEAVKEKVNAAIRTNNQLTDIPLNEKALINKANKFFNQITGKLQPFLNSHTLESFGFGIKSPEFFLFSFKINKEKLMVKNMTDEYDFIIKVSIYDNKEIILEIIGEGIQEKDEVVFANKLYEKIQQILGSVTANGS